MGISRYFAPGRTPEQRQVQEYRKSRFSIAPADFTLPPEVLTPDSPISEEDEKMATPEMLDTKTPDIRTIAVSAPSHAPRRILQYPAGDFRNNGKDDLRDIKSDVMVNWLHQQQMEMLWTAGAPDEGVMLKKARGNYTCCPSDLADEPYGFYKAIEALNVKAAMTVNTRVIKLFLHNNDKPFVPLKGGLRLQVLPDMNYLPRCQKHQFAAFIADRGLLIVWDDEPKHLLNRAENIERALMQMLWNEDEDEDMDGPPEKSAYAYEVDEVDGEDELERADVYQPRPPNLLQAALTSLTLCILVAVLGGGIKNIAFEILVDNKWLRVLLLATLPTEIWLSLFFFQALVGNLAQLVGPISHMNQNSKYYSGIPPKRLDQVNGQLPHITVQMPVYKEGLASVIVPTIHSIKAAMSTYEMQGGTANIFINDDGMQLIPEEEAQERQDFYDEHNIGWVARPRHDPRGEKGEPFTRAGKFKKASNMNYSMWVSCRVEDKLLEVERHEKWSQDDEAEAYKNALLECVEEDCGRTWADGNIRMGDYVLIIDSDTRVPEDCLIDAISEMERSPEVAILQQASGVMNVTDNFFERGITFFTNLVYDQIKFAVAAGDVAPFVGHNAFLRWAAVQSIGYECEDDHREKWWSEATVSEDFDMALRLQAAGYIVRLGGYTNGGFEEGVSITVYDELARWEKYAFGCNELVFFPVAQWWKKGLFTPLIKDFARSPIPFPSKCTIMAYVGTYYALGSAWVLTLANYFLIGWYNGYLDKYYVNSFKVYLAIIVVFTLLGNLSLAVLRYRIEKKSLLSAMYENYHWVPLMTTFLGGVSIHVSQALLSHMFGIEMNWGSTNKEAVNTTFFEEVPKIAKMFKGTFAFVFFGVTVMLVGAFVVPWDWQIDLLIAIYPLTTILVAHLLLPIALNPNLMKFTF